MTDRPTSDELPEPGRHDLIFLQTDTHREIYTILWENRGNPLTMVEIREAMARRMGKSHAQIDRRLRDLREFFDISAERIDGAHRYLLLGPTSRPIERRDAVTGKDRAAVLAPGRCARCGRTPLKHGVVLVVDHILPLHWGGKNFVENLQPLCEQCNREKKAYFDVFETYSNEIKAASGFDEPHKRIGELLKAFHGDWVPSELLGVVASLGQYQEDWQRRLRELRMIGWKIGSRRKKDPVTGRVMVEYKASEWQPWPNSSVRQAIARHDSADSPSAVPWSEPLTD